MELKIGVARPGRARAPFTCADCGARDRRFVAEFHDEERYGAHFARFIESASAMLQA